MTADTTNTWGRYNGPGSGRPRPADGLPAAYPPDREGREYAEPNRHGRTEPDIPFGNLPSQVMPASWASAMLCKFYARDRNKFGKYLQEYITKDLTAGQGDGDQP